MKLHDEQRPAVVDLIILTGFLGSGKTTLLSSYLRHRQAADTAVIVNEVGEIDLDGAILNSTASKVPMALLSNGCVCCAVGADLAGTIAALIEERATQGLPPLARIVLETSGLSRPGPILRSLGPLFEHLRAFVVSTFDCVRGTETLALPEAAAQVAAAYRFVLTRLDMVDPVAVPELVSLLERINPLAEVVSERDADARALAALAPLVGRAGAEAVSGSWNAPLSGEDYPSSADALAYSRIRTALCRFTAPVDGDALAEWLDNLAGLCGNRLLRVKGVVDVERASHPMLVQCVGTLFAPLMPLPTRRSERFLVVIVRDMLLAELRTVAPRLPFEINTSDARKHALGRGLEAVLAEACS